MRAGSLADAEPSRGLAGCPRTGLPTLAERCPGWAGATVRRTLAGGVPSSEVPIRGCLQTTAVVFTYAPGIAA